MASKSTKSSHAAARAGSLVAPGIAAFSSVHVENGADRSEPTLELAKSLQSAADRIKEELIGGKRRPVLVTLDRRATSGGYYRSDAMQSVDGRIVDQIALNPTFIALAGPFETLRMIARLCVLQWREKTCTRALAGRPGTPGYRDRSWARMMDRIGLAPSTTGDPDDPGDRRTGYGVGDVVVQGGPFDLLAREMLLAGEIVSWRDSPKSVVLEGRFDDRETARGRPRRTRSTPLRRTREKFTCQTCGLNAWAKPTARLVCGDCQTRMLRAETVQ